MKRSPVAFLLLLPAPLRAAAVVHASPAAWTSAVPDLVVTTESFDTLPFLVLTDGVTVPTLSGVTLLGAGAGGLAILGPGGSDFATPFINADFEDLTTKLIFTFPAPVSGFGFDYVGADNAGSIWITCSTGEQFGTTPNAPLNAPRFMGVSSDLPITWFSLSTNSSDQEYSIDNLRFATIPEPSIMGLLALPVMLFVSGRKKD